MAPTRNYKRGLQVIKENFTIERVTGYECVPGRQQTIYWDKKQQGLGLRVTASGVKSYVVDTAFSQEQLLDGVDAPTGIQIMNVHKAKGKQFDGVIVVREGRRDQNGFESSFVWRDDTAPYAKSRRIVRVAITRAQTHALILDPMWPRCPIIGKHALAKA